MNSCPAARESQDAGFTQPRDHSFAQPCTSDNDVDHDCGDLYSSAYFYGLSESTESETDMFSSLDTRDYDDGV